MEDRERQYWSSGQGQAGSVLPDSDQFFTDSFEVTDWFNSGLSDTGSFDVGIVVTSSFSKLLDVLPIPAMLIDYSYKVAFANQACATISNNYKIIQGVPFSSLVPRPRNAEKARAVVKKVFITRKPIVAEGILEIDARKVWGRLYFRSVRIGTERYILLVVEDLTNEKTRLLLRQKRDAEKNEVISAATERLSEETWLRERVEGALQYERSKFRKLVELLDFSTAILGSDGRFRYISPDFKDLFGEVTDRLSVYGEEPNGSVGEPDRHFKTILNWLADLGSSQEQSPPEGRFTLQRDDGSVKRILCRAVKLDTEEYLIACEDLTKRGDPGES